MRFAFAFLLLVAALGPAGAQDKARNSDEILRQRLLLKERFNKGWDVQLENARDRIEGRCKAEAKKRYSAFRPLKRRQFAKECIERARR
jgi:lipase chaperone LimK